MPEESDALKSLKAWFDMQLTYELRLLRGDLQSIRNELSDVKKQAEKKAEMNKWAAGLIISGILFPLVTGILLFLLLTQGRT